MIDGRPEPEPVDGGAVISLAQEILRRTHPTASLELVAPIVDHPGYRHAVFRCELTVGTRRRSVVVKRANDPASTVEREAAALRLLTEFASTRALVPELVAHAAQSGLLILEDLGTGPRLREVLLGDDPLRARSALLDWMRALATIHGATHAAAVAGTPNTLRTSPRPDAPLGSLGFLPQRLSAVGLASPAGLDHELRATAERRHAADWSSALTVQDVAPSNALVDDDGRVRLYDLEFAGFRSALVDGSYPFVRVFRANDTGRLPTALRDELASVYRDTLAERLPEAADDDLYGIAHADAVVIRVAAALARLPKWLASDRLRFRATERQRILAGLGACTDDHEVRSRLPRVHAAFVALFDELERLWAADLAPFPTFPALRSGATE